MIHDSGINHLRTFDDELCNDKVPGAMEIHDGASVLSCVLQSDVSNSQSSLAGHRYMPLVLVFDEVRRLKLAPDEKRFDSKFATQPGTSLG